MNRFLTTAHRCRRKEYLQKYMEGDLEAKHILIERNLRLVAHVMKKYQNLNEDPEDLISIGTIGLIKAITTFDPTRNNRLAAYASKCIHNEILMMLRAKKKTSKDVSLYQSIGTDKEGNEICLYDVLEASDHDIHDKMILKENTRLLYQHMEQLLTEREQYDPADAVWTFSGKRIYPARDRTGTRNLQILHFPHRKKCHRKTSKALSR